MLRVVAIVPSKKLTSVQAMEAALNKALDAYADDVITTMATYPTAKPWKDPPKKGLRAGGRRTGNYGRGWRKLNDGSGKRRVENNVSYAKWVGGPNNKSPGQARNMKSRGWPSITTVARERVKKYRPVINRAVTAFWT